MANVGVAEIDRDTGYTRLGGVGVVYADIPTALAAAESAADALIVAEGGTKVVNNTSGRVYVVQEKVMTIEDDIQANNSPGDGVTLTTTREFVRRKWWILP